MAITEQQLTGTIDTVFATGSTSSLASAAAVLSTAYSPTSANYPFAEVELTVTFASAPNAGTAFSIYFLRSPDGTNYEDGDATPTVPARQADVVVPVRAVTSGQRETRVAALPAGTFKVLVVNGTNQSASSGWGLKVRPFTRQSV